MRRQASAQEQRRRALEAHTRRGPASPPADHPMLWEVSADNGNGTYNLKASQGGTTVLDSVTRSNVYPWDTDETLAVGDRGILVERGDGALVFFKHIVSEVTTMIRPETAKTITISGSPSPTWAMHWIRNAGSTTGLSLLLYALSAVQSMTDMRMFMPVSNYGSIYCYLTSVSAPRTITAIVTAYAITQNFDISTLDYATYATLSKTSLGTATQSGRVENFGGAGDVRAGAANGSTGMAFEKADLNNDVYGLSLEWTSFTDDGGNVNTGQAILGQASMMGAAGDGTFWPRIIDADVTI